MLDGVPTRSSASLRASLLLAALASVFFASPESALARSRHHHGRTHYAMPAGATDPAKDAALIVDGATGKVLYSRNATAERHPASLTKMMTLYLLFEALKRGDVNMQTMLPIS